MDDDLQDAVAVGTAHAKQVHGGIVHAHQQPDASCLLRHQEVAMGGRQTAELGRTQVKIQTILASPIKSIFVPPIKSILVPRTSHLVPRTILVPPNIQIRIEPQKPTEVHQEHQMEIGKVALALVQPLNAGADVLEQRLVLLLVAQGVIQKLADEEGGQSMPR